MWRAFGFLAKLGSLLLERFWPSKERELGRVEAERDALKETVERTQTANKARERARRDPVFIERVRKKYRRK